MNNLKNTLDQRNTKTKVATELVKEISLMAMSNRISIFTSDKVRDSILFKNIIKLNLFFEYGI
jgi:hypothetical protein